MVTNPETLKTLYVPEFTKKIPTNLNFSMNLQVYEVIRNVLLLRGITAKTDPESTDQCTHIFIKNGKKVLFEYMDNYINDRACIYTGKGDLVAVDTVDLNYISCIGDNYKNRAPNYMELISDLIFWKANTTRKHFCADEWLKQQPQYKPMMDYIVPALKTQHR